MGVCVVVEPEVRNGRTTDVDTELDESCTNHEWRLIIQTEQPHFEAYVGT